MDICPLYTNTRNLSGLALLRDRFRFHFWWRVNSVYLRFWHHLKVIGSEHIPPTGGALLVGNHEGFLDGNMVSAASCRKVAFMIAREYFDLVFLNWMCRYLSCIPVNRTGQDTKAIRNALQALDEGRLVACFPEGGLTPETGKGEAKLGVGLLVARSRAPVIPIWIEPYPLTGIAGSLLRRKQLEVRVGHPLVFEDNDIKNRVSREELSETIWKAVQELGNNHQILAGN